MVKQICCDVDGILTEEVFGYGKDFYPKRTPNLCNIETLKDYKRRGFEIKLYTARYLSDEVMTREWLKKYDVPFDSLTLGKPQAHEYIDDRATNQLDREILCLSGGVDSIIALHFLGFPNSIYIDLHTKYTGKEVNCINNLRKIIPKLKGRFENGLELGRFETGDRAYISMRNFHVALLASHFGNKIYIVGIKGDDVPDKNAHAYDIMSHAMNFIKKPTEPTIKIVSPFWEMTKTDIIKWFLDNYPKAYVKKILKTSVSCYDESTMESCGACPSCFRKFVAVTASGIDCIKWFESDIRKWKGIKGYKERIEKGMYDIKRSQETREVLEKYNLW